uniref:Endodeoxyribonuclease n=1 Tax=uncultured marine virus TaxID=186617 RepID=A0A0F7L8I7_9VIRU|nr:endodeoxyribonuclease [uncultured marine virus]
MLLLFKVLLALIKTKRISRGLSAYCLWINKCFARSDDMKRPLASRITPLSRTKSGV